MANGSLLSNTSNVTQIVVPEGAVLVYNIYLSMIIALGVLGNLLVLFVYFKNKTVNSSDWFIIFITVYDIITASVNVPIYLTFTNGTWKLYGSDIICKLHMFLSQSVVLSSTFLICGLAIERYVKVCQPSRTKLTPEKSRNICLVICLISVICSTPTLLFFHNKDNQCIMAGKGMPPKLMNIYFIAVVLTYVTAIVVLLFTYSKIAITILQSQMNLRKHALTGTEKITQSALKECFRNVFCCITNKIYPAQQSTEERSRLSDRNPAVLFQKINKFGSKVITNKEVVNGECLSGAATNQSNILNAQLGTSQMVRNLEEIPGSGLNQWNEPEAGGARASTEIYFQSHHFITSDRQNQVDRNIGSTHTYQPPANGQVEKSIVRQPSSQPTAKLDISSLSEHTRVRQCLRTTRIAFLICVIFVLSWLPPWTTYIVYILLMPELTPSYLTITMFCRMTYLVNSFTNPILYTALNTKFRERLKKSLCLK